MSEGSIMYLKGVTEKKKKKKKKKLNLLLALQIGNTMHL